MVREKGNSIFDEILQRESGGNESVSALCTKPFWAVANDKPHGSRLRYVSGCRCLPCRAANARYEGWRVHARKEGDWNGVIPAGRARRHLKLLSRVGIGRRTVAEISGVPQSLVHQIKTGRRRRIRARTERRIFLVTSQAMNEARLVRADSTWRMIGRLLEEGFSRAEIARRLGFRSPCLQIKRTRVRARTAARVERFYRRVMVA